MEVVGIPAVTLHARCLEGSADLRQWESNSSGPLVRFRELDIANLRAIAVKLDMVALQHALSLYARLTRLLFVDNQPSDVWIQGDNLVGIPQGCPLACFFCNLSSIAWHVACERAVPNAKSYSYLDDRLALCGSWRELNDVLVATQHVDTALGLN